jgi:alkaline phosphatase D
VLHTTRTLSNHDSQHKTHVRMLHTNCQKPQVRESYGNQTASQQYQAFLQTGVEVQGVYDDHDFGVNDVGSELGEHRERMDAFLDFIGASAADPRRTQEAIYSSHVYGPPHKQVKVCALHCYHIAFTCCLLACSSLAR